MHKCPTTEYPQIGKGVRIGAVLLALSTAMVCAWIMLTMTASSTIEILRPSGFDPLRLAAAVDLARFKGLSRAHCEF